MDYKYEKDALVGAEGAVEDWTWTVGPAPHDHGFMWEVRGSEPLQHWQSRHLPLSVFTALGEVLYCMDHADLRERMFRLEEVGHHVPTSVEKAKEQRKVRTRPRRPLGVQVGQG